MIIYLNISNQHAVHTQTKRTQLQQTAQPSRHFSLSKHLQVQLQLGLWIELQQLQQDFRSQHDFEEELLVGSASTCFGCVVTVSSGWAIIATKWWMYLSLENNLFLYESMHLISAICAATQWRGNTTIIMLRVSNVWMSKFCIILYMAFIIPSNYHIFGSHLVSLTWLAVQVAINYMCTFIIS